jgi:cytochrome P450
MSQPRLPGPKGLFTSLRLGMRFKADILNFLSDLHRQHGDFVYLRLGPYRTYWLFHPDLIHEALATKAQHFRRGGRTISVLRQWFGSGLLTSDGDQWHRQRQVVHPYAHGHYLAAYAEAMVAATQRLVSRWQAFRPARVEILQAMVGLTQEIIAQLLFGADVSAETRQLDEAVTALSEATMSESTMLFSWPSWVPLPSVRRRRRAIRCLDDMLERIIRERRASGQDRDDVLSGLLRSADQPGNGDGLTPQQARDIAITMFLGGHETTAATLSWIWYLLARHPEVQDRVVAQVEQVLQGRTATAADVPHLDYLECILKETLRLYPDCYVLFPRIATEEVSIGGYPIVRGGQVYAAPWVVHRDPRWYPAPEKFEPERFSHERVSQLHANAFLGFGAGPRVCVGTALATMQIVLIVATVVQHFHLELAPGQGEVEPMPLFTLRPRGGIQMTVTPRTPPDTSGTKAGVMSPM